MYNYHAFGLNISSDIELPGLMEALDKDVAEVKIKLDKINLPLIDTCSDTNYFVDGRDVYLWWEGIGSVQISSGSKITVDLEDSDVNRIIPFLLGPVMAFILHQKGFLVLHGSAVKIHGGVVAFLGYRGFGKSTIAINLYTKGYPLVADDLLAIKFDEEGKAIVYPGYPHTRLSGDSYNNIKDKIRALTSIRTISGKNFYDASCGFSPEPQKLERIYTLVKDDQVGIFSLNSQDSIMDLIRHSVAQRIFLGNDQAEHLTQCAMLINKVSIKGLKVDHSFINLPKLIDFIEEDIRKDYERNHWYIS